MLQTATEEMIAYFGRDVRRINHALKVTAFAGTIAAAENACERDRAVLALAAPLHDIGIPEAERKHGSSAGPYQEKVGPPVARPILERMSVEPAVAERVCHLIGSHHSYSKIDGLDFQILVEADFLVNIFEDGMDRPAVESILDKYFRTVSGTRLIESMYLK